MIELTGLALVNWHLFSVADVSFAGNSAILGKNASGKSTLIDLIQTVMTGGSAGFYRFNRSAGEGGGRSERSLRGYCLGQTDQGVTLRTQGITHIALRFEGPDRPRPVTLGLCLEVAPNEEARVVGRYVADGIAAGRDVFTELKDGAEHPAAWPVVRARLTIACESIGGQLHEHPPQAAARVFIREYMRVLFTGRRQPNPDRFIKAFIMALSFEDMRSVEDFVRGYLLEQNDINIADLRESIQRYQQIQRDIAELEQKIQMLRPIQAEIDRFESLLEQEDTAERMRRLANVLATGKVLFAVLSERRAKRLEIEELTDNLKRLSAGITYAEEEKESIRAQVEATGADAQRHALSTEIQLRDRDRDDLVARLRFRFLPVARAIELIGHRDRFQAMGLGLGQLMIDLEAIAKEGAALPPPAWPKNPDHMEQLVARGAVTAGERLERITTKRDETTALRVASQGRIVDLRAQLAEAHQGRVPLHPQTVALMEALRSAGFRPRAVCEVVDIKDENWREAAEALLGRDREAIIVDPEHTEQAVSLLRRERNRYPGCRIANTRKLVGLPHEAEPRSLASVFGGSDALAVAFIVFRLGNVRLADTQAELMSRGRAIMTDGTYYDGLVVEIRRPDGLKIGRVAASLMSDVVGKDLESEQQILETHRRNEGVLSDLYQRLVLLSAAVPEEERLGAITIALTDVEERRADLRDRYEKIGMQLDPKLRQAQVKVTATLEGLRRELGDHQKDIGRTETELKGLDVKLSAGAAAPGSWHSVNYSLGQLRERVRSTEVFRRDRAIYAQRRGQRTDARFSQELEAEHKRLGEARQQSDAKIRDDVITYCLGFAVQRPFDRDSKVLGDIKPWLVDTLALLEGNELVRYKRQADDAAERITYLFRSSFVHELNSRFRSLEQEIDDLKAALRTKRLHGEVYSLYAQVRPEFRSLYELSRASEADERVLAMLFNPGALTDHPFAGAIAEVERLLRDPEARFEAYQDYRNYYNFDLRLRDANGHETSYDRRRGVASGAERQVPFYVIIGAALSSIYHGIRRSEEVEQGLGLAVFDEAFSKMDGQNQRTMLEFYNEIGLQVLIAAPTEKRAIVYENLNSVIDVYRFGNHAELEVSQIKGASSSCYVGC